MTAPIVFDRHEWSDLFALRFGRHRDTGEQVLQKVSRGHMAALHLLRAEVAVGERLAGSATAAYPAQLCRLVDHSLDGEAPYVTTTYRGTPIGRDPVTTRPETALTVLGDLMLAVQELTKTGVTHGAVVPDSVLWDGHHAQLINLGTTTAIGEPYAPALPAAWQPPSPPGGLRADPAHDVYQAGLLVHWLVNDQQPAGAGTVRQWFADHPTAPLAAVLAGVFADDPADRPHPLELLRRIEQPRTEPVWQPRATTPAPVASSTVVGKATVPAPVAAPPVAAVPPVAAPPVAAPPAAVPAATTPTAAAPAPPVVAPVSAPPTAAAPVSAPPAVAVSTEAASTDPESTQTVRIPARPVTVPSQAVPPQAVPSHMGPPQAVVSRAVPVAPLSPARREYRQKMAAKREYRAHRDEPVRAAWRYARDLFDVLWHQQSSPAVRAALVGAVLLAVALPVIVLVVLVDLVKGLL